MTPYQPYNGKFHSPFTCIYGRHLLKPEPDPKPGFGGFPNPKPETRVWQQGSGFGIPS